MPALTAAEVVNYTIEQGATFRRTLTWYSDNNNSIARDLSTGWTARMQIRSTVASDTIILSLTSSPAAGLTLTSGVNNIEIHITPAQSAAFTFTTAVYDLELVAPTGDVTRLIKGTLTLDKEVTR